MNKEEIKILFRNYITGDLTEEDFLKVNEYLKEGKYHHIWEEVINNHTIEDTGAALDDITKYNLLSRILNSQKTSSGGRFKIQSLLKYAAALLVALGISWSLFFFNSQQEQQSVNVAVVAKSNDKGRKTTFNLPDGTIVKLNSSSKLQFPEYFDRQKREVLLEGEAFFEVLRDESRPFVIKSGNIRTTVLGTSFNINAHPASDHIEVAVVSGKVRVESLTKSSEAKGHKSVLLTKNVKAVYKKNLDSLTTTSFLAEEDLAWKDGVILFKNASEEDVVNKLEEWYGVKIIIENQGDKNWDLSAKFKNETLEHVLKVIGHQRGFKFNISRKNVTIKYKCMK
ncbi:MAG: FecR domain-containing protein [Cytophagales bacterium]|nr:FecR domain-containing protein [Cytophagales bacterium]